jgi:ribosomal protein L21E
MPAGHGTRARTRDSFSRPFRGKGYIPLSVYLRTYHIGDYVDIKVNSAVQKVCRRSPPRRAGGRGCLRGVHWTRRTALRQAAALHYNSKRCQRTAGHSARA